MAGGCLRASARPALWQVRFVMLADTGDQCSGRLIHADQVHLSALTAIAEHDLVDRTRPGQVPEVSVGHVDLDAARM